MRFVPRFCLALALVAPPAHAQDAWRPLFNGTTLDGWQRCNGTAPYTVEDGAIVGRTIVDSPNSFLCSTATYGDFILEYRIKLEGDMNSGVQIRSLHDPAVKGGRVHGLQVEVDPSARAWSGGIYDESRRGWLHPLTGQDAARHAFKPGDWNTFRVEAIGASVRTWVNGVPAANILDTLTPRGIIALQVHAIGSDTTKAGQTVRFRDLRIATERLDALRTPDTPGVPQYNFVPNTISDAEAKAGWTLLWDGKTTNGWRGAKLTSFPAGGWRIADGVLTVKESGGSESADGGDIVTVDRYGDFELIAEFKITRGANSGIKYFVDTGLNTGPGSAIGCEFQILDDDVHPDAKLGVGGNRTLGGLYDLMAPVAVRFNGVGEWNRARIVAKGQKVEHWLNGFKTVEYERGTQMWRALVSHSKYVVWPSFGEAARGHILLQDHGNEVSFRTIKIRTL